MKWKQNKNNIAVSGNYGNNSTGDYDGTTTASASTADDNTNNGNNNYSSDGGHGGSGSGGHCCGWEDGGCFCY